MRIYKPLIALLVSLGIAACGAEDPKEHLGTVEQNFSGTYGQLMTSLKPVAWWTFDDQGSPYATDITGHGHIGYYTHANTDGSATWVPGALNNSGVAMHVATYTGEADVVATCGYWNGGSGFNDYCGPRVEVPIQYKNRDFNITKAWDNFDNYSNTPYGTWGTPTDLGNTWTPNPGTTWSMVWPGYGQEAYYGKGSYGSLYWSYINQMSAVGNWGQVFPYNRDDSDVTVQVWWDHTSGVTYIPLILAANYSDPYNYYGAELYQEPVINGSGGAIRLVTFKYVNGVGQLLSTSGVLGTVAGLPYPSYYWNVRLQVTSTHTDLNGTVSKSLRAKAWQELPNITAQPNNWTVQSTDFAPSLPGKSLAVLSYNGYGNHTNVYYKKYRVQSPGMSVSAWIRPTSNAYHGSNDPLSECPNNGNIALFTYPISKMGIGTNQDWAIRQYPIYAQCSPTVGRADLMSAYIWSNPFLPGYDGQGAGQIFKDPARQNASGVTPYVTGYWRHVVVTYDPGDYTDLTAGVSTYLNGVFRSKGGPGSADTYGYSQYLINMMPGDQPVRFGAANNGTNAYNGSPWTQFQGDIDDVSIYDYVLTQQNVSDLFSYHGAYTFY